MGKIAGSYKKDFSQARPTVPRGESADMMRDMEKMTAAATACWTNEAKSQVCCLGSQLGRSDFSYLQEMN